MKKAFVLAFLLLIFDLANAQHKYFAPTDPLVLKNLDQWQDRKFGLFMHWGTYSQWGIVESWSLCPKMKAGLNVAVLMPTTILNM